MEPPFRIGVALQRIRNLYVEIPDIRLSLVDVMRISGLDQHDCRGLLRAMVDARFLIKLPDGGYQYCERGIYEAITAQA